MNVRLLAVADAPAYRILMLEALQQNPDAFTSSAAERAVLPLSWWEARLGSSADAATSLVIGAFDHRAELVGLAGLEFETREKVRHKAHLFGMYVAPVARGQGAGAAMIGPLLDLARARAGVRMVRLTVTAGNQSAEQLYRHFGFVEFGLEPMAVAVGDGFVAKRHMACDLGGAPLSAGR